MLKWYVYFVKRAWVFVSFIFPIILLTFSRYLPVSCLVSKLKFAGGPKLVNLRIEGIHCFYKTSICVKMQDFLWLIDWMIKLLPIVNRLPSLWKKIKGFCLNSRHLKFGRPKSVALTQRLPEKAALGYIQSSSSFLLSAAKKRSKRKIITFGLSAPF